MADAKISQLPVATTPLAGTELVPVVQGGVTDQTTVEAILTGTVPSGTANGVLFLNGSKVVTSGSALTFDGTNFGVGTSNFEIYDTNAGSNVSTFYRLKYTGGNGQTNVGTAFSNDSSGSALGFWRNNSAAKPVRGAAISADWASITAGSESASLIFSTQSGGFAASEQMRLTSTGLGIGTSSPNTILSVNAGDGVGVLSPVITTQSSTTTYGGMYAVRDGAGDQRGLVWQTFTANVGLGEKMRLDSSGNLGLGVTPSVTDALYYRSFELGKNGSGLHAVTTSLTTSELTWLTNNSYPTYSSGIVWKYGNDGSAVRYALEDGEHKWFTAPSGTAGNPITFTQAMTLDASGRLLIGTTSNLSGEPLQIDGNGVGSTVYTALIRNTSTSTSVYNMVRWGQNATGSAVGYIGTGGSTVGNPAFQNTFVVGTQTSNALVFNTNDAERARIPAAGGMVVGTAALATTATDGFLYVPTCAGTPTGTPTTQTGTAPIVVDTTNNKLYFYSGGQWRDAGP